MSIFRSLFGLQQRTLSLQQWSQWVDRGAWWRPTVTGATIQFDSAMTIAVVFACVRILAETLGTLPVILYKPSAKGGNTEAKDEPEYDLLKNGFNEDSTAINFWESYVMSCALTGNAYAFTERGNDGRVVGGYFIHPNYVTPVRVSANQMQQVTDTAMQPVKNELIAYRVRYQDDQQPVYLFQGDSMLHMPFMSQNGITGMSPLAYHRETFGLALGQEEFQARLFKNGATPKGVLMTEAALDISEIALIRDEWNKSQEGVANAGRTAVLPHNIKFQPIQMTAQDAQYIDSRKFMLEEIARIFRVPPHLLQELSRATNNNIEHQSLEFVIHTIRPWAVRIEQTCEKYLLTKEQRKAGWFIRLNLDALLRGDTTARFQGYSTAISSGIKTQNECRKEEFLNPMPNADLLWVPMNVSKDGAAPGPEVPSGTNKPQAKPTNQNKPGDPSTKTGKNSLDPRVERAFLGIIRDASERVVRKEVATVSNRLKKFTRSQFADWLPDFYVEMRDYYEQQLTPVLVRAAEGFTDVDDEVKASISAALKRSADIYTEYSCSVLRGLANEASSMVALMEGAQGVLDGWTKTRAELLADELLTTIIEKAEVQNERSVA